MRMYSQEVSVLGCPDDGAYENAGEDVRIQSESIPLSIPVTVKCSSGNLLVAAKKNSLMRLNSIMRKYKIPAIMMEAWTTTLLPIW